MVCYTFQLQIIPARSLWLKTLKARVLCAFQIALCLRKPVFDSEGRMLSSANAMIRLPYVWVISGVETHPEFRRRGYASSVVSKLIKEAFQNVKSVMLFTSRNNTEAISVYNKLGF